MSFKDPQDEPEVKGRLRQNVIRERINFNSYKLDDRQTIDSHIDTLRTLVSACEFGDQAEVRIIEKILSEYSKVSIDILEILDHEQNVTLERVLDLVRGKEKMIEPVETADGHQEVGEGREIIAHPKVITKDEINTIVDLSLKNKKPMSLNQVEILIKTQFHCSPSHDDGKYIKEVYTESLIELWLDEASENAMNLMNNPLELIEELRNINVLERCICFGLNLKLCRLVYNNLMVEFCKHSTFDTTREKKTILKFKSTFLTFILLKSTYLQGEINFHRCLIRTMKSSKYVNELCNSLSLINFLETEEDETIGFRKLLRDIINCSVLKDSYRLKTAAQAVVGQDRYFLIKGFKDTITAYLKPVVMTERQLDGRKLLEVMGEHIVIGQVLEDIERTPGFGEMGEIRFVNAGVIHIDEDLNSKIWHGKNIVVFAETVIVSIEKNVSWDVSGQDAKSELTEQAGTSYEGVGLEGAEGKSGESGGNVMLICDEIENAPYLKIVSNGGKGGNGQEGGNGCNGKDGDYMYEIDFKNNFPPVSKFFSSSKQENLEKTRLSIMDNIQSVKLSVLGKLIPVTVNDFDDILAKCTMELNDIYCETKTKTGCQISFSFYSASSKIFECCQSFLLHKGANGEPGKEAGKGGAGGKGGFAGEVEVVVSENPKCKEVDIVICAIKGEDGKRGESGAIGKPGKSGLDCAYIDSTKPKLPLLNVQFPKYFLIHSLDAQRLRVEYHSVKGPERIYCSHNGQYAEITRVNKELYQSCTLQNTSTEKEQTRSQFKVQVNRKKTISLKCVLEQYEHKTPVIDHLKLDSIEKEIKQIHEEISSEEMLYVEKVAKETRITRNIEFSFYDRQRIGSSTVPGIADQNIFNTSPTVEPLTETVCNPATDDNYWSSLVQAKHDLQELNCFWNTINIQTIYLSKEKSTKEAQIMLSNKYQLAVLNYLEQTSLLKNISSESLTTYIPKVVGSVESTLSISNQSESFSHVESYLCNDSKDKRLSVIRKLDESADDWHFCMKIFNLYLDEYSEFDDCEKFLSDSYLEAYKKHYNWFKLKKAKSMRTKLLPILNDVTSNKDMYNKLIKAITEQNIHFKIDIEHQIRGNPLLNIFYKMYIEEVNKPFVWKSILLSQKALASKIVEGFKFAIHQKGPSSVFFREVVAGLFNTNILLYTINECNNEMVLVHNHNPSADEVVNVLIRDDQCFKLENNEGLSQIIRAYEEKGQMCSRIQFHVNLIKEQEAYKEEFDKFISDSPFSLDDYNGVSKSAEIRIKISHMLMEDENIQSIASSFELEEDQKLISSRLQMLKHECVGYQSFLYYIALHMKTEGTKLSVKELCCIINFLLKSVVDSSSKINIVSWIIAAHHQTDWIIEFTIFKLELYFKVPLENDMKNTWREHLRNTNRGTCILFFDKLGCDESLLKIENADEVLVLVSQVPNYLVDLSQLSLDEWKYYLKDIFWTIQMRNTGNWSEEELKIASYYLATMENSFGKELCCKFIELIKSPSISIISSENDKLKVLNTLKLLTNKENLFNEKLLELLSQANVCQWEDIAENKCFSSEGERSLNDLRALIKMSSNTSQLICSNIDETVLSVEKVSCIFDFLKGKINNESNLKKWISNLLTMFEGSSVPLFDKVKSHQTKISINDEMTIHFQEMQKIFMKVKQDSSLTMQKPSDFFQFNLVEIFLATICVLICIKFKKTLRNTQLLAIMTFLKTSENVLGQVSTGEGKSFIIIAVAIMKALSGSKVDIITSSHVLAKRDAEAYAHMCKMFGIEVGHNCLESIEERKTTYSKCHVVYGELSYFQRDFLLDRVYNQNILGDRTYETILVDEVDSMLLDKGNNVLYLSHDIPGLDKLEPLFVFIWKYLNVPSLGNDDEFFNVDRLKHDILNEMYGLIQIEDIKNLDKSLEGSAVQTWSHLVKEGVIDSFGKVLCEHFDDSKVSEVVKNCIHEDGVKYLLKKVIIREKEFEVPNYLKTFVEDHLDKWIDSAINAINLKNNIDYVVDVDRSDNSSDRNPNIVIVDRDTGTDLTNSQWDQGLHQFLQLKHGCRISPLTFKAVFISNVSYLKMYTNLLGLTGTLGSMGDRNLLKEIYNVEFVTIPTAKSKKFTEEIPILCNSSDDWSTKIVEKVYEVTNTRSALIICHSLSDVFTLKKCFEMFALKEKLPMREIQTYTRDYEELNVESLDIGNVIISTNLAGRGTDIQLSKKLIGNGGLHVCLSFLPSNSRIEEQAFGRSARNGQPGSGQMIFKDYGQNNISKVIDLKKERNRNEIFRISDVKKYYETKIKPEEELFHNFLEKYKSLRESKHCQEIKGILQMACLDQWAFWLERSSISGVPLCVSDLIKSISKLSVDDFDTWAHQIQDPFQLTKLGLCFIKKDDDKAVQLFDRVIKTEPDFCEAAYYYRACARTSKHDTSKDNLKHLINELIIVKKKLKKRIVCTLRSGQFIDYLKKYNSRNILQIDSYKLQQHIVSKTYEIYMESINNIIGHPVTPEEFSVIDIKCQPEIDEHERMSSIIFSDLVDKNIIQFKIKDEITEGDLNFTSEYGICPKSVKNILDRIDVRSRQGIEGLILRRFKKDYPLPSREMFWKELMSVGILENEEKYAFVNHKKLDTIDPSCGDKIKALAIDINPPMRNKVSLYSPEELGYSEDNFKDCYSLFLKRELKTEIGETKFKFLKQENIMLFNKQASFSNLLMKTVELSYFDNVTQEDFLKIGIPNDTASSIVENLIQEKVIGVKKNCDRPQYALLVNFEGIDKVELRSHKAYLPDVKSLLSHCFAFRIAIQKLQHIVPLCKENYNNLCLPLRINLYKMFWFDLLEREIIEQKINNEEMNSEKFQTMYSTSMNKESYIELFSKMYDKEKSKQIVDDLIKKEWLKNTIFFSDFQINKTFSRGGGPTYCIDVKCEKNENEVQLVKPKMLLDKLKCEMKTIELYLLYNFHLSRSGESIKNIVKHLAGSIHEVNTPILSLTPLEKVLAESRSPTSEINTFNLNGFNQVIDLEEKKYTSAMKNGVFCITMLALVEITVGVGLQLMYFPIGPYLLNQGIDDAIFVTDCVLSGHFSLRSYKSQKLISLVTTSISCYVALKSTFAIKSAGMTVQTMKEKALGTLSKIGSSVRYLFSSEVPSKVTKTEIITQIGKRVLVHAAEGIAYGASFSLVDRVIQSQQESLGESLTRLVHGDIDKTITNHPVFQSVIDQLYMKLGDGRTKNIIETSLCKTTSSYEVKLQETFNSIDLRSIFTLIERTISKDFNRISGLSKASQIFTSLQSVWAVLKKSRSYIKEVSGLVDDILNHVKQELLTELEKLRDKRDSQVELDEVNAFKCEVLNFMQCNVRSVFSAHISKNIVLPIIQVVGSCVEKFSVKMISKTRQHFLTEEEIFKLSRNKNQHFKKRIKMKSEIKRPSFFSDEFDEITREVLKTRKNKMVLSYLVSQNAPMNMHCLELCCEVISVALKQEGLSVPTLRIEVEKNGTKQFFCIGDVTDDTPTLRITPDADLSSNVKNNKILVTDVFNFLCKSFLENYPELKDLTATLLQELVVKAIDHYCNSQSSGSTADDRNEINTECEKKVPYQHSIFEGGWIFNPHVDVDLRENNNLSNIQKHVSKGFETALVKVNTHIHRIQSCLSSFNLVLSDFSATKHQLAPPPPDMSELFHCYTVQYELVIPVMLKGVNRLVDFNILLRLENEKPKNKLALKSPLGPHILYEINPVSEAKFLNKGLKGHILLNTDITIARYSLNDCHVAGELIVSSVLQKPVTLRESEAENLWPREMEGIAQSCGVGQGEATNKECDASKAPSCEVRQVEATNKVCDAGKTPSCEVGQDEAANKECDAGKPPSCEVGQGEATNKECDAGKPPSCEVGQDEASNKECDAGKPPSCEVGQDEASNKECDAGKPPSCEVGQDEATNKECDAGKPPSCEVGQGEASNKECDAGKAPSCEVGQDEASNKECDAGKAPSCEVGQGEGTIKECDAIIIGDSLFKHIEDYIRLPKCDFGIFPHCNLNKFRMKIISFLANYEVIKCVVLFLGNDIVKSYIPEDKLVNCIFDVVKHIQGNIGNVKVVICTLSLGKQSANKYNEKISNVNRILKDYCTSENLITVDTNMIICPQDLGKDGIHLNRSGYHKLGKHISEVCRGIIECKK